MPSLDPESDTLPLGHFLSKNLLHQKMVKNNIADFARNYLSSDFQGIIIMIACPHGFYLLFESCDLKILHVSNV